MRTTIDAAGRLVVPKPLRQQLGFSAGSELEVRVVDDHLEVTIPSLVKLEEGPHGLRFTAGSSERLSAEQVRELMDRGRR